MGFRCPRISRNTLANANERRDWRIYADFGQVLIAEARALYAGEELGTALDQTVYALDATVIDLCLSLFPWAPHQRSTAAVKVHTLLDLRGNIPSFLHISGAHTSDVSVLDHLPLQAGAFYIMDRGYIHFKRLYALAQAAAFFVVRARANMRFRRRYSHPVDKTSGLRSDQTIVFTGDASSHDYPAPARRVHFFDTTHHHDLVFLTNHFALPAMTIAQLYKSRWKVELFFESSTWCTPSDAMELQGSVVPNCPLAGTSTDSVRPGIVQRPLHADSTVRLGRAAWPAAVSAGSVAEQW